MRRKKPIWPNTLPYPEWNRSFKQVNGAGPLPKAKKRYPALVATLCLCAEMCFRNGGGRQATAFGYAWGFYNLSRSGGFAAGRSGRFPCAPAVVAEVPRRPEPPRAQRHCHVQKKAA
ncbi:hypothetical protein [Desulfovibrio desulfuricans]|uniref:hypothetical protein n=1 Tax=Desulfovibrio desulfuricans TaxID=876 RepID=UPI001C00C73C|nr:hypothetical protein [Desulfovibrio desulfuricans]MBT9749288.1 hypothetical protein [Desulfovibrio desulfuricans]MCB6541527.1 hypothetical protein [Desulfovibrio desulfuricans]MCB6552608.1 hypothetical protein [Desulfovibrio desulfuricans]MCB7345633.1 hypothetical protein [Desulfovibrio desulfuricans]MCQ4861082.1 hypothetical protein [Desulfovibrio desulfuricans]